MFIYVVFIYLSINFFYYLTTYLYRFFYFFIFLFIYLPIYLLQLIWLDPLAASIELILN